jgi:hypothetical protein
VNGEKPRNVEPVEDATFVRPFVMTGGRAEPLQADLRLETLVVAGQIACRQPAELPLQMLERIRDHVRAL